MRVGIFFINPQVREKREKKGVAMNESKLAVLIIADSQRASETIQHILQSGGFDVRFRRVTTKPAIVEALEKTSWDLIVSEYSLTNLTVTEALRILQGGNLEIPFIIVAEKFEKCDAFAVMDDGAHDFVFKSSLLRLLPVARRALRAAADRLDKKNAEFKLYEQNKQLKMLGDIARKLLLRMDMAQVFEMVVQYASELLESEHGALYLYNPDLAVMEAKHGTGSFAGYAGSRIKPSLGVSSIVWNTGKGGIIEDYSTWERRDPSPRWDMLKATVVAPLMVKHQVVGLVALSRIDSEKKFTTESLLLLTQFASLASIAVYNAYLWQGMQHELEERKRSEQQALRYRDIIERTPDMVFIFEAAGKIVDANRSAQEAYGYTLQELMKFPVENLRAPEHRAQLQSFLDKAALSNQLIETVHIRRNGQRFPVEVSVSRIDLETGMGFVGIARDISERKDAEESLRTNYNQLAETMEKLKRTQSQLLHQEKLASIGQLAAGVAHEINNPLGFVSANIESLGKYSECFAKIINAYRDFCRSAGFMDSEALLAKQRELAQVEETNKIDFLLSDYGDIIQESKDGIRRMINIVKGLNTFSRIDNQGKFSEYDLNEGIQSTLIVARNETKYNSTVETELALLPKIFASGGQINQVLLNILVNASQAIKSVQQPDRIGFIRIRTFLSGAYVGCSIFNDGPPIPPEIINRIFEPFFTTKEVGKGTGLGLSISYEIIVHLHHGKLEVESSAEKGTTFTLFLPVIQDLEETVP